MPSIVDYTYTPGITGGAFLHLRRWEPVSPQFELMFTSRGSSGEIGGVNQGRFDLYYVDMLVLARAEIPIEPVILFAIAGPEASVLLKSTLTSPDGVTSPETGFGRFDLGMVAGAGVAFGPFSWGTMTLEARYEMGLIDISEELQDVTLTNRTISFTLGYEYRRSSSRSTAR